MPEEFLNQSSLGVLPPNISDLLIQRRGERYKTAQRRREIDSQTITASIAASELLRRHSARNSFGRFCEEVLSVRGLKPAKHHNLFINELSCVAAGLPSHQRSLFIAPPGSGKSTYVTVLFPAWLFQVWPGCQIIGASHTGDLAEDFSRKIHAIIRDEENLLHYSLATENAGRWYTTNGGAYLAAGVGAAIPGFRADIAIIDDPIRGRLDADSDARRKTVWDWYNGDLDRRRTPEAPIILMHTRWHMDDLAGRILLAEEHKWRVVHLSAEAGENDILGRSPGEMLWSDDQYGYGASLREIRDDLLARGASREWYSQYQGSPRDQEGALFKTDRIGVLETLPAGGKTVRAYDLAATKDTEERDPAWTRGVKLTLLPNERLVISDVASCRGGPDEVERLIVNTAGHDGKSIRIGLPQDPGQAGKAQVTYLSKRLHGYIFESSPETGDKATRAAPIISQVNVGNVDIVAGSWNRQFLDELASFPAGAHSDQVDALSRAYSMLLDRGKPFILPKEALPQFQTKFQAPTYMRRDRFGRVNGIIH